MKTYSEHLEAVQTLYPEFTTGDSAVVKALANFVTILEIRWQVLEERDLTVVESVFKDFCSTPCDSIGKKCLSALKGVTATELDHFQSCAIIANDYGKVAQSEKALRILQKLENVEISCEQSRNAWEIAKTFQFSC